MIECPELLQFAFNDRISSVDFVIVFLWYISDSRLVIADRSQAVEKNRISSCSSTEDLSQKCELRSWIGHQKDFYLYLRLVIVFVFYNYWN